jgi:phage tail-like protein
MFVHRLRGRARYPNIVLSRGVTFEDELLKWFFAVEQPDQRPTLTIALLDQLGNQVRHWALDAAQPVRWSGPDGKAQSNGAARESLEVSHIGFL